MRQDIRTIPLQVKADNRCRLLIPLAVRRTMRIKPYEVFNMHMTETGDIFLSRLATSKGASVSE